MRGLGADPRLLNGNKRELRHQVGLYHFTSQCCFSGAQRPRKKTSSKEVQQREFVCLCRKRALEGGWVKSAHARL